MNNKYEILNSKSNYDSIIFYLLYIVLIFVVVFIIFKIIYKFNNYENFKNTTDNQNKLSPETMQELIEKNNELTNIKNSIQDKLEKQSKAIYISQNYDKIDSSSFDNEVDFILGKFNSTTFPQMNLDGKKIINTESDLSSVLNEVKLMKNFYKPGDIVLTNSTFDIDKNKICYRQDGKLIKPTVDFLQKYPECMVCTVESEQNLYESNPWKTTKTNINKVCLYNPTAETNSGIPNLNDCKKFCNVK